jgi:HAD superfamily hydrolase (TIGR01509 family)
VNSIRSNRYRAAIFDFDGVLVESAEAYRLALSEAVAPVEREDWPRLFGMTTVEAVEFAAGDAVPRTRFKEISVAIDRRVGELLAGTPPVRDGAETVLEELSRRGLSMAVASSASRFAIDGALDTLNWKRYFGSVVGREDVARSKPHPDAYTCAVANLKEDPGAAFAIEDTVIGTHSARAAGLFVVALGGTQSREELCDADLFFESFSDLRLSDWYRTIVGATA